MHSAASRASQPRLVPRLRGGRLYDFLEERTHEGRKLRLLNIIDEFTHECLAIRVSRRLKSIDVIDVLSGLFILRGIPEHIRSDNGPEFLAKAVQEWIAAVGAKTTGAGHCPVRQFYTIPSNRSALRSPTRIAGPKDELKDAAISIIGGAHL